MFDRKRTPWASASHRSGAVSYARFWKQLKSDRDARYRKAVARRNKATQALCAVKETGTIEQVQAATVELNSAHRDVHECPPFAWEAPTSRGIRW